MSRRSFIGLSGMAALSVALINPLFDFDWFDTDKHTMQNLKYVITDRRHSESLAFFKAVSSADQGNSPHLEVTDGLTLLWQESLVPLWKKNNGVIMGLTTAGVLDCLAEQARSYGHRPVFLGNHSIDALSGKAEHIIQAPDKIIKNITLAKNENWIEELAQLVRHCPIDKHNYQAKWQSSSKSFSETTSHQLVSWIIA